MRMNRKITVGLNQEEISNLINQLESISEKLEKIGNKINDELAETGLKEMQNNYRSAEYQAEDGMGFAKAGSETEKKISMIGTQAIYTEFGTGTYGEQNPHPQKSQFELREYNSGRTIRKNKNAGSVASENGIPLGGLYWTYKDLEGNKHYTQGIPAQKIVFDANKTMKEKIPSICKEAVEEVLR